MSLDEADIVARSRDGKLSGREIDDLIELLAEQPKDSATYTRLNALGWTMRPDLADAVTPLLVRAVDPMLSRLALQILVGRWGLGRDFAAAVIEFPTASNGMKTTTSGSSP